MTDVIELKPCPFCGTELTTQYFPQVMTVRPVHSEEYFIAKLNKGHFLGSDNYYNVVCIKCGATGARGVTKKVAIEAWNRRANDDKP